MYLHGIFAYIWLIFMLTRSIDIAVPWILWVAKDTCNWQRAALLHRYRIVAVLSLKSGRKSEKRRENSEYIFRNSDVVLFSKY